MGHHQIYNYLSFGSSRGVADDARERMRNSKSHRRVVWATADGERIRVGRLSDGHLRNIARLLIRLAKRFQYDIPLPCFSGEMASYYAENEYDRWTEADPEDVAMWVFGMKAAAIFEECLDRGLDYEEEKP
jgi:hypothetical protein